MEGPLLTHVDQRQVLGGGAAFHGARVRRRDAALPGRGPGAGRLAVGPLVSTPRPVEGQKCRPASASCRANLASRLRREWVGPLCRGRTRASLNPFPSRASGKRHDLPASLSCTPRSCGSNCTRNAVASRRRPPRRRSRPPADARGPDVRAASWASPATPVPGRAAPCPREGRRATPPARPDVGAQSSRSADEQATSEDAATHTLS